MSTSRHVRSLRTVAPRYHGPLGEQRAVTAETFPILTRMSMQHLRIAPGAPPEPQWHASAKALAYCLRGRLQVSVLDNASAFGTFTITPGQLFHIPVGALQAIENVG